MLRRLLVLFLAVAPLAYAIENVTVDSITRDVINPGAVNFAVGQLKVNGIAVVGGGGGGGGGGGTGTIDNVRLNLPVALFVSPVSYTITGGLAEGTAVLAPQPANTFFANLTGSPATPIFVTTSAVKTALAIDNVNNTSDASKPISTATQAALDVLTTNVATNTTNIATNTTAIAGKADTSAMTTALAAKASITYVDTQDATKQNSWGVPGVNGYIAAGNTNGTLFWVNPTTLGTTSATYTDGVTNSTTLLTSATAGFTSTDVGKTVTGSGIPGSTTISTVNSGTSVTLSASATTSVNPLTFVILNRFAGGGGGTVTLFTASGLTPLFTTSVSSGSSTPSLSFSLSNAPPNTFYGNSAGLSGPPAFMDAPTALTGLGVTTVGKSLFTLTNPSLVSFLRINSDNTVTTRIASELRTDIGAGTVSNFSITNNNSALFSASLTNPTTTPAIQFDPVTVAANTFYGNSTASPANPSFMSASAARTALGGTTAGQNLFTLANPSAITYPRISATNVVTAVSPATVISDIGAVATTDARLPSSVIGIRKSAGAGSTDLPAVVNQDYAANGELPIGNSSGTWTTGKTVLRQSAPLTANQTTTLPPANAYAPGTPITFIDGLTTGNFGRGFFRAGSDTINGGTSGTGAFFIAGANGPNGAKSVTFETDGVSAWRALGSGNIAYVEDSNNASFKFGFSALLQDPLNPGVVTAPSGSSVTVTPQSSFRGQFVNSVGPDGSVGLQQIFQRDVRSNIDEILGITANMHSVPDTGDIDNIRLSVALTAPLTLTLPSTQSYSNGQALFFLDNSGSVSTANTVIIVPLGTDTVNGGASVVLNRPFDSRRIVANPTTGNWTVEAYGGTVNGLSIGPYLPVTDAANITLVCDQNLVEQNWKLTGTSGVGVTRTIAITNAREGERFTLNYTHYTTNDTVVFQNAATASGGAGLLTLSSNGVGTLDVITGKVIANSKLVLNAPQLNETFAAPATYNTLADSGAPTNTGANNGNIGNVASTKYYGFQFVAGSSYICGRVDLDLKTFGNAGNLNGNILVDIVADKVRSIDSGAAIASGSNVVTNATTIVAADVGQRVTSSVPGVIPDPSYIGAVDTTAHTFTIVTTKGGSTGQTIGTSGTGVNIWGVPDTTPLVTSNPVGVATITTNYSSTYISFTGFTVSIASGTTYWIVPHVDTPLSNGADYIQLRLAGGNTGFNTRSGASANALTTVATTSNKGNFNTYKP